MVENGSLWLISRSPFYGYGIRSNPYSDWNGYCSTHKRRIKEIVLLIVWLDHDADGRCMPAINFWYSLWVHSLWRLNCGLELLFYVSFVFILECGNMMVSYFLGKLCLMYDSIETMYYILSQDLKTPSHLKTS